jgi:hypothetical protein
MSNPRVLRTAVVCSTVIGLASVSLLHFAWGTGSTFPFTEREELNDAVIGRQATPSPAACHTVAVALAASAVVVTRAHRGRTLRSRTASTALTVILASRAALGLTGRTDLAVPGSNSPRFKRLDRIYYAPLCAFLATGAGLAALPRSRRGV